MSQVDVYLLTEGRYVSPKETDWYIEQILHEDGLVQSALEAQGYIVQRVDWADSTIEWTNGRIALFRTTWDYFDRFDEFRDWFEKNRHIISFINPAELIEWNLDKHYLLDLEAKGVPIVPSHFVETGNKTSLEAECRLLNERFGWQEFILKPCVSGGARHTYRFKEPELSGLEETFQGLIKKEPMMLQEFHQSIMTDGELSHMVIDGAYTHSIRKVGAQGEFRVQDDWGGKVEDYSASSDEKDFAEFVMAQCPNEALYGRVDVMFDQKGQPMVSELELIEPELWFRNNPDSAKRLGAAIDRILS